MHVIKAKKLDSFFEKSKGLMFADKITPTFIETRWGIHTFFVKEPIDVVVLDNEMRVVKIKKRLKTWRIFTWNPKYKNILEMPEGYIKKKKIKVDMEMELI